ncbi:MAG: putative capsid protein [Circoviridae sp.]|nr:MAG: putative capsid protein [Circoviridae sp.]
MARDPTKKPRTLRRKNIKRRTGAKAQSKQIMALTRSVAKMNSEQTNKVRTCWQRNNLPIGAGAIATPYICPLPYALCDPLGNSPVGGAQVWSDNRVNASQPTFQKRLVFGYAEASANSNKIYHTGGKLRYSLYTDEPSYTKVTICLIRAKKKQADQLITDRNFKGSTGAGSAGSEARIYDDVDYTVHNGTGGPNDTWYGAEINRKYWDVLYKREVALGSIKDLSASTVTRVTPVDTPKNNSLVATGSISLPAAGEIKAVGYLTSTAPAGSSATAMEQQYVDQRNEDSLYLVAIHNDISADLQNVSMGFVVTDYYKAVV